MARPPVLRCVVNGEERDLAATWTWLHPIDELSYEALCAEVADVDTGLSIDEHPVRI